MKCNQCGFENNDNANFCANCGADLRSEMADDTTQTDPEKAGELDVISVEEPEEETAASPAADHEEEPVQETGFILVDEQGEEEKPRSLSEELFIQTNRLKEEDPAKELKKEEPVLAEPEPDHDVQWYYVDRGQSRGPFDQGLFEEMAANGTIGPRTYIWKPGMESWMRLEETDFGRKLMAQSAAQPETPEQPAEDPLAALEARNREEKARQAKAEEEKQNSTGSEWFYVHNSRSSGPYADEVMGQFIRSGLLDASTYVWKEGMDDWQHLGNTTLARYLSTAGERPHTSAESGFGGTTGTFYSVPNQGNGYAPYAVRDHSVILYIVLYFVTCGFFGLYWLYQSAKDVDALAAANNKPKGVDPVLALILDIVTCGLFKIYFFWKEGMVLNSVTESRNNDQAILLCILGIICPVAAFAILQDQINSVVRG